MNKFFFTMYYSKYVLFILFLAFMSCTGHKSGGKTDNSAVAIEVEEIKFPPQDVLQMKSYYLSSPIHTDSADFLVGYNYRSHSLDYINLKSKSITQTVLFSEGPDAVTSLTGIYVHTLDSIWVSDESERIFLIDNTGKIKKAINLKDNLQDTEQSMINTNHAMFTSHLYYNKMHRSLMFLVKNSSSKTFVVRELFVDKEGEAINYELSPSSIIPDISVGYNYMDAPNVNFTTENIIYNYPVESSIYILNIQTKQRRIITANSQYTANVVEKVEAGIDYPTLEKSRIQNPHFFDVMYIPKLNMYARLHLGEIGFDEKKEMGELMSARILYLMTFNEKMEKTGETKLSEHRYNNFTGWSASYGGIALFVDNMLDEGNNTDDLIIDMVTPKKVN